MIFMMALFNERTSSCSPSIKDLGLMFSESICLLMMLWM